MSMQSMSQQIFEDLFFLARKKRKTEILYLFASFWMLKGESDPSKRVIENWYKFDFILNLLFGQANVSKIYDTENPIDAISSFILQKNQMDFNGKLMWNFMAINER